MSKRLQVLMAPREYRTFQTLAHQAGLSLGEWVRRILRQTVEQKSRRDPSQKLDSIRVAYKHHFPTADIDRMLDEIEKGYLG
ncbi:MAG: antitoxin [Deltaproteobacteria bacterium]|nr:antitoxin [Deltaproteobacteria bacterium]